MRKVRKVREFFKNTNIGGFGAFLSMTLPITSRAESEEIITIAGSSNPGVSGDNGLATSARLYWPRGLSIDFAGNLYIADTFNGRIRMVNTCGVITTVAGTGAYNRNGDTEHAASTSLVFPCCVTVDSAGNIYIADTGNNRIRKVSTSGMITTVAGNGSEGFSGDFGPAWSASLFYPQGVSVDLAGNIYIADTGNNRIRKVNTSGVITTVAGGGTEGFSGDFGPAWSASLFYPQGVSVDSAGNIYIADSGNCRIRKVSTTGMITTVAGNGIRGFNGENCPATSASLLYPQGVSVDLAGNIYIADTYNSRIRKVNTSGVITTVAGNGARCFKGDNGPAAAASLFYPFGVAVDSMGNIFIGDTNNNRIRMVGALIGGPDAIFAPAFGILGMMPKSAVTAG